MNGAAAKEVRRDIRRAFGPVALQTLDEQAAVIAALNARIVMLAESVTELRQQVDGLIASRQSMGQQIDRQEQAIAELRVKLAYVQDDHATFRARTWRQRLAWVIGVGR